MSAQNEIFGIGLGLQEPWYIESSEMVQGVLNIKINFRKGSKFPDPSTGEIYGVYRTKTRKIKHLLMRQYQTILEVRIPEIRTIDESIVTVDLPLFDKGSKFTYLFEGFILQMAQSMPLYKIAKMVKEDDHTIMRIVKKYVDKGMKTANYADITSGCIDETSSKKGHKYITSFINLKTNKVSAVVEGKGKDSVEGLVDILEEHGAKREKIESVCIDLSPAFKAGCKELFPNASIVFDKFHIIQILNKALDKVRIAEAKQNKGLLEKTRWLRLRDSDNLKDDEKKRLKAICLQNEALGKAYELKESFKTLYQFGTVAEAKRYLHSWCDLVGTTALRPFKDVVKMLRTNEQGVLAFIEKRITNGLMEGTNGIIQGIKKRARGFKNIHNFITMIYLHLGDFTIIYAT